MSRLGETRSLLVEALRTLNDLSDNAPPELETGLGRIRDILHSAVERIDAERNPNPLWPDLAARA
jgi:hypothetical protein